MIDGLITIERLKKYFYTRGGTVRAVDGITFEIRENETLGLVGESGSGKSTVAYTVMGVYSPTEGNITYQGHDISITAGRRSKRLKKDIQIVFQDPGSSLNPRRSIQQTLELPLRLHAISHKKTDIKVKVAMLLEKVHLPADYMYKYPQAIGGGERQMVAIARALATDPSFVVLDEPTSALGQKQQMEVLKTIMRVRARGDIAIVFITHNEIHAQLTADRFTFLSLGKVIGSGSKDDLAHDEIRKLMAGGAEMADLEKEITALQTD